MQLPAITSPLFSPLLAPSRSHTANNSDNAQQPPALNGAANVGQTEEEYPSSSLSQSTSKELSDTDHRQIAELKKIDRQVRAHEAAHIAAAGALARGGASYSYTQGPDGQRYAVAGEVSIDTSPVRNNPDATLLKAQRIQAAALAPAQPSSADRAVAASAAQMAASARAELLAQRLEAEESNHGEPKANEQASSTFSKNEAADKNEETSFNNVVASENQSTDSTKLAHLIQHATSVENELGNLLNTAV